MDGYPYHTYQSHYPVNYFAKTGAGPFDAQRMLAAGGFGFIVGGSAALGVNLHKVQANHMTLNDALIDSVAKGAGAGVATAAASAASSAVGGSGILSFAVMAATATGVIYLLNSIGKRPASDVVLPTKKTK